MERGLDPLMPGGAQLSNIRIVVADIGVDANFDPCYALELGVAQSLVKGIKDPFAAQNFIGPASYLPSVFLADQVKDLVVDLDVKDILAVGLACVRFDAVLVARIKVILTV